MNETMSVIYTDICSTTFLLMFDSCGYLWGSYSGKITLIDEKSKMCWSSFFSSAI